MTLGTILYILLFFVSVFISIMYLEFGAMALMGLKLWQLSELALPLVVMLLAQTAMMALFARFVIFNLMGRDYEAAVITAAGLSLIHI